MRTLRLTVIGFIFAAIFAGSALAQAQQTPAKVALVSTDAFLEKDGIKKIADAYKALEVEFKADFTELENMLKKLQALQAEIEGMQKANPPAKPEAIQAKVDEGEKLQRSFKFKQEDTKVRYDKREAAVLGPIIQDVGKAIGEYAKQKGFSLVLDSGKLYKAGMLLYFQDTTEITKDFIQFYNTRPAGTAAAKPE
ncbi:MAG: OmpH family outer membrane protein [Pyrinomonadaceae bacterium]